MTEADAGPEAARRNRGLRDSGTFWVGARTRDGSWTVDRGLALQVTATAPAVTSAVRKRSTRRPDQQSSPGRCSAAQAATCSSAGMSARPLSESS